MPLKPNVVERFLINKGMIPGLMTDMALPLFQVCAMLGAMEIGLFRHLQDSPADLKTLAERTNASERGLEILINALEPMGYLQYNNGKYSLTKQARNMPIDRLELMSKYFQHFASEVIPQLGHAFREAPEEGVYGWENVKSGEIGKSYQATMRWLASSMIDEVVKKIDLPDSCESMLDVGGSHGKYTVEFCRKYPNLKGTILDWKIGLEEAEKTLNENQDVADRIDLVEGDFEQQELPEGYDFAFLGNIIHGISEEGNRELFNKLSKATTNRGIVGIQDQFAGIKGSQFARSVAGLAGLNLFLFTAGRSYPFEDVKSWLYDVGFSKSKLHNLSQPGMSLVVASKQ